MLREKREKQYTKREKKARSKGGRERGDEKNSLTDSFPFSEHGPFPDPAEWRCVKTLVALSTRPVLDPVWLQNKQGMESSLGACMMLRSWEGFYESQPLS